MRDGDVLTHATLSQTVEYPSAPVQSCKTTYHKKQVRIVDLTTHLPIGGSPLLSKANDVQVDGVDVAQVQERNQATAK